MSKAAKVSFLIAFLLLIAAFAVQFITGAWLNLNTVILAFAGAAVVFAVVMDWKLYFEFFTMRTTKHGMNMGAMILLVVTLLVCVNYLANRHNKTWDLTHEKLNSLSDQSTALLKGLKNDMEVKVFYQGPNAQEERQRVKQSLSLYQDYSGRLKVRYINSYVDQEAALEYLKDFPDKDSAPVIVLIEYGGKKVRVDQPYDEAAITSAMIKATREGESKIYFVQGHGEKDINADEDPGLKEFAKALGEASFKVEALNLIDKKEIPKDAAVVAIIGPQVPYLDQELQWLRDYVRGGGKLFIALDPGQRHNLANLTKTLGVQFENNYVLTRTPIVGGGPVTILGRSFDAASDITKSFPAGASFAVFPLASEVKAAADKSPDVQVTELVKSDNYSFTLIDPTKPLAKAPDTKPVTVAVEVKGKVANAEEKAAPKKDEKKDEKTDEKKDEGKTFEAVIFGDSDFISNRGLMMGINRDLAMNAVAQLAQQKDLLSIKPKMPKGTMIVLTYVQKIAILIAGLALPVLLLIGSGVMWFRRRGA